MKALLQNHFPRLVNFQLPDLEDDVLPLIRKFLMLDLHPCITGLDFSACCSPDSIILPIILCLSDHQLKRLKLRGTSECEATRHSILDTILFYQSECLEMLEFVNFETYGDQWLESKWIQNVMSSCLNLEVLRIEIDEIEGPFLEVDDVLKGDWVCLKLRHLQVEMCLDCAHPELAYDDTQNPEQQCDHAFDPLWHHTICSPWCPRREAGYEWQCIPGIWGLEQHHFVCHLKLQRLYVQLAKLVKLEVLDVAVRVPIYSTRALTRIQISVPWALGSMGTRRERTSFPLPLPPPSSPLVRTEEMVEEEEVRSGASSTTTPTTMTQIDTGLYLEALSTLRNMREFDFSGTRCTLRVAELRWMKENWTKLERLAGLPLDPAKSPFALSEGGDEDDEDMSPRQWCRKYWPNLNLEAAAFPRAIPWGTV